MKKSPPKPMRKAFVAMFLMFQLAFFGAQGQPVHFEWATGMGNTGNDRGESIVTDLAGNVYTTGYFRGSMDCDPGPAVVLLVASGLDDIFISKIDSAKNLVWAKRIGSTSNDAGLGIAVDTFGNVYTTGYYGGTTDFDPGAGNATLTTPALNTFVAFVSKLDKDGNYVWAKRLAGVNNSYGRTVALDKYGNVHTAGRFQGTVDFNPNTGTANLTSSAGYDIYINKLNSAGSYLWARRMGGTGDDVCNSIAIDTFENVYTTGNFGGTVDFDPGVGVFNLVTPTTSADVFVSKLDSAGFFVWAKRMGGTSTDVGNSIKVDLAQNIYTTGYFAGTADFDPGTGVYNLVSTTNDIFVSKLDINGDFAWAKRMGSNGSDWGYSVALDPLNNVYVTGFFNNTVDFNPDAGTYNLVSAGLEDIFVCKLNNLGAFVWATRTGGVNVDGGVSIGLDTDGNIYTTGYFYGTVDFNPGTGTANLVSVGLTDIYTQKLGPCVGPIAPTNTTLAANQAVCYNANTTLSASGLGTLSWYTASTGGSFLGGGANYTTSNLTTTTDFYVQDSTCGSGARTLITVVVNPEITSTFNLDFPPCNGDSSGSAEITAIGGTGTLAYSWSNGVFTEINMNLTAGVYTCTITDANSCTLISSATIEDPSIITISTSSQANATCFGYNDGFSVASASGGTGGLTYSWSNGTTTANNTGLTAGVYVCLVIDGNGCSSNQSVTITEPAAINTSTAVNGFTISANATGTTYQWIDCNNNNTPINGETNQSFTAIANGNYAVIITDGACSDTSACVNITGVSIHELAIEGLSLYPNPTKDFVTLEIEQNFNSANIEVLNALGQVVWTAQTSDAKSSIALPQTAGIYFVRVTMDGLNGVYKIIKE